MRTPMNWTAMAIVTLMMGLEPLVVGATVTREPVVAGPQVTLTDSNPMLIAKHDRPTKKKVKKSKLQKPRLKTQSGRPASAAEVETFLNVHRVGMGAVRGCVTNGFVRDCERLVSSKSSLENWCLQGKTEACSLFQTLSSQEAYQLTSDALLDSVK